MKYAVVFSSLTGNTEMLAKEAQRILGEGDCLYFGTPGDEAAAAVAQAELVLVGSWTNRGNASADMISFMAALEDSSVFLFGTCGFGGDQTYFDAVLDRMKQALPESTQVAGDFMCQGKMPQSVRTRYVAMLEQDESSMTPDMQKQFQLAFGGSKQRVQGMIDNFDRALEHPNAEDLTAFGASLAGALSTR